MTSQVASLLSRFLYLCAHQEYTFLAFVGDNNPYHALCSLLHFLSMWAYTEIFCHHPPFQGNILGEAYMYQIFLQTLHLGKVIYFRKNDNMDSHEGESLVYSVHVSRHPLSKQKIFLDHFYIQGHNAHGNVFPRSIQNF